MSVLAEGAATINASLEMPDVWRRVLNQTMQALQVETAALALIDHANNDIVFHAAAGLNSENILSKRIPDGQGLAGLVVKDRRGLIVPNVGADKRYGEADQFEGVEMRALAIAPIQSQGKIIGVLEAINPVSGAFDLDAMLVMTGLGSFAGTTIQNAQFLELLQKERKRYRELFEDSVDPILITDWDGKVLEANRQAATLSGYSAEQLRAMSVDQLHETKWNKIGMNYETLKSGEERVYESVLFTQKGGKIPVEIHAHRVEIEETDSLQWIMRDITARKDLDALRDDMISMIYHDLRSPLGNIVSSLTLMSEILPDDETLRSMLAIAGNSTGRIQRLVNSLLDINRLESGQKIVDQKAVDPLTLIKEAIRDVEPSAAGRQQTVENVTIVALPLVWVDVDMVYRVLVNLLENAIKFTPIEGRIEIGATPTQDGFIKFFVRDTGPGISAADAERVFDKFTRLRGKEKQPGGLGVGLAFCRLATLGHGGKIWVESELGKGATFCLTLPVAQKQTASEVKRHTGSLTIKEN